MITQRMLGILLKEQLILNQPFDPDVVADWAHRKKCDLWRELSNEMYDILERLAVMCMGPEFYYTFKKIEFLAHQLIMDQKIVTEDEWRQAKVSEPIAVSRKWLGNELLQCVQKQATFDPSKVAYWAEGVQLCYKDKLTKELDDILQVLMAMTLGPEFLYSEKQLCFLSERLISEDSDALNKMCQFG